MDNTPRLLSFYGASDDLCEIEGYREGEPDEFSPDYPDNTGIVEIRVPDTDEGLCVNWLFNQEGLWSVGISQLREGVPLPLWEWTYITPKRYKEETYGHTVKLQMAVPHLAQMRQVWPDPEDD